MRRTLALLLALALTSAVTASAPHTAAPASRPFDAERAYRGLERQCAFGPRVPGSKAHQQCAEWLAKQLEGCGAEVRWQQFTADVGGKRLRLTNIVAVFNPPDGRRASPMAKRHILLAAHWDSRPTADRDPDRTKRSSPVPGANDGASGVAVLLEIARALKAHPPRARVTIALFDGEDYGREAAGMFLGSRYFAAHFSGPPVAWGVLLDMVGDGDLRLPIEQHSQRLAPAVVERIWGAAERAGSAAFVREQGPAIEDDHLPLLKRGIPCVDVIDFGYAYWHTVSDTPDKCSSASLGQVGQAVLQAIAEEEAAGRG